MKRLTKKADETKDTTEAVTILKRVAAAAGDIKDAYYSLFDNLNALYDEFPQIYNELKLIVKLPDNNNAILTSKFKQDLDDTMVYLSDKDFLDSIMTNPNINLPDKTLTQDESQDNSAGPQDNMSEPGSMSPEPESMPSESEFENE